jgi:hypothetical protein
VKESAGQTRAHLFGDIRRQDGFVREAILVFIVLTVFGVILLDILSVYSTHRDLKDDAGNAAQAAMQEYVQSTSDLAAQQAAESYLKAHDATLLDFKANHLDGETWYAVTAQTTADTYVFHYLARLPWGMGAWMDRQLHPKETRDNRQ